MQRIAFQLHLRPEAIEKYEEAHKRVWPELIAEMENLGAREYSIFRQETQLFLYLRVPNVDLFLSGLSHSDVNARWQEKMAPLLDSDAGAIEIMNEVFYMEGRSGRHS